MKKKLLNLVSKLKQPSNIVKGVCVLLVGGAICGSTFYAAQSFAKYRQEFIENNNAGIAFPIANYHRNHLYRISRDKELFTYTINNNADEFIFENIQPKDCIYYYFYISNYDKDGNINQVSLKVDINIRVYLQRLKDDGSTRYFVIGHDYVVGSNYDGTDFEEDTSMRDANLEILYSQGDYATKDENDYIIMPREDYLSVTDKTLTDSQYENGKDLIITKSNKKEVIHKTGFYFKASSSVIERAYLVRITIPEQYQESEQYISGRLFLSVDVNIEQVLK